MKTVEIVCVAIVIVCILIFSGLLGLAWKAGAKDLAEINKRREEREETLDTKVSED